MLWKAIDHAQVNATSKIESENQNRQGVMVRPRKDSLRRSRHAEFAAGPANLRKIDMIKIDLELRS